MSLHKAVVLVVGVGCSQSPLPPEVLTGGTNGAPPPAISISAPSLQTRTALPVLLTPSPGGKRIGTLASGARVRGVASVTGDGCILGWVALAPRGYVCGDVLDLSQEPPWSVSPATAPGSGFRGYVFAEHGTSLPLGVVMATRTFMPILETKWGPMPTPTPTPARTQASKKAGKGPVAPLMPPMRPAEAYRVSDGTWLPARQVRVIDMAPLPVGYRDDERWIDIDLDAQTLCAYEGLVPVFATLVSTGVDAAPTPPGIYRVWKKVVDAQAITVPQGEGESASKVAAWAQIFIPETGIALQPRAASDRLGAKDGRGHVLLAPADAAWLYAWSAPDHASGWTMSAGVIESPGTLIQLRSGQHPKPPLRGYAITVHERDQGY